MGIIVELVKALETLTPLILAGVVLAVSAYLVISLINRLVRHSSSSTARLLLIDSLEKRRYEELVSVSEISMLEGRLTELKAEKFRLELEEEVEKSTNGSNNEVETDTVTTDKLNEISARIEAIQKKIRRHRSDIRREAKIYAEAIANDLGESSICLEGEDRSKLVLEYTTVIIILAAIIVLSLVGILTGEQLTPVLASIAGYVLGRSSLERTQA